MIVLAGSDGRWKYVEGETEPDAWLPSIVEPAVWKELEEKFLCKKFS